MPKYEYLCSSCKQTSEVEQRMTDDHLSACPQCGAETIERLIGGGVGVITKSGGAPAGPPPSCGSCNQAGGGGCPYSG